MSNLDITGIVTFDSITQEMFPRCTPRIFTCRVSGDILKIMLNTNNRFNVYTHSNVDMVCTSADSFGNITLVELLRP